MDDGRWCGCGRFVVGDGCGGIVDGCLECSLVGDGGCDGVGGIDGDGLGDVINE